MKSKEATITQMVIDLADESEKQYFKARENEALKNPKTPSTDMGIPLLRWADGRRRSYALVPYDMFEDMFKVVFPKGGSAPNETVILGNKPGHPDNREPRPEDYTEEWQDNAPTQTVGEG